MCGKQTPRSYSVTDLPKIQVTDRELWFLKYYGKLLPKWECEMWAKFSEVTDGHDEVVEVYLLTERNNYGATQFKHVFQGYAVVNIDCYWTISDGKFLD